MSEEVKMPRVYKPDPAGRKYKKYDPQIIRKAVVEYATSDNVSMAKIAKKYGIKKSVLYRHSTRSMKKQGGQKALSDEAELYLIEQINKYTELGYSLDTMGLRYTVKTYLDNLGIKHKRFRNNIPGPDFVNSFLQRHKNVISQKVLPSVSTVTIKEYYNELQKSLDGVSSSNIINYDKIYLPSNPGQKKVLIDYIDKCPERIPNRDSGSLSIIIAGTADGRMLPPYVLSKALHLNNLSPKQGPDHTQYERSTSGWLNGISFEGWIKDVVIPYCKDTPGKKCLIGNSLWSHFSDDIIHDCKEHNINFVPFSSNYLKNPIKVAFFRQMRHTWRKILLKWRNTYDCQLNTISEGYLNKLLILLFDGLYVNAAKNIITGFRTTGIYPLNFNLMLSILPNDNLNQIQKMPEEPVADHKMIQNDSRNVISLKRKRRFLVPVSKSVDDVKIDDNAVTQNECHVINPEPIMKKRKTITIIEETEEVENSNDQTITDEVEESENIDSQKLLKNPSEEVYLLIVCKEDSDE